MKPTIFLMFGFFCFNANAESFLSYIRMASDENLGMNKRWSSLISAASLSDSKNIDQIRSFTSNKQWYMRNASLIALFKADPSIAVIEAKKLLKDKALVVRSAAVEVVSKNLTSEHKKVLEEEFMKNYNFHKNSSLWIRKQIIEKLSSTAGRQDRDFFAKNLFDTDKDVSLISAKTLEKITGLSVEAPDVVEKWKALVKEKNWL